MKLKYFARDTSKKNEVKRVRREGNIPAVLYAATKPAETIMVKTLEFQSLLRQVLPGRLPTTVFSLTDASGKERRAIVKDIQYHVTTYDVIHLDFEELHDDVKVNVKVPIECTGVVDCAGIKLGGVLRQVIRHMPVRCLPANIPATFELDVKNLVLGQSRRLSDLKIPATVRPLTNLKEVAVAIVKR